MTENEKKKYKDLENALAQAKRENQNVSAEAEAMKAEAANSLDIAATQLANANAVALGIFGLSRLAETHIARRVMENRIMAREVGFFGAIEKLIADTMKADKGPLPASVVEHATTLNTWLVDLRTQISNNRAQAISMSTEMGYAAFYDTFDRLTKVEE